MSKVFRFTSTTDIEAKTKEQAECKFASSSWNFAAEAECEEITKSSKMTYNEAVSYVNGIQERIADASTYAQYNEQDFQDLIEKLST